jgi:hypothetical protein
MASLALSSQLAYSESTDKEFYLDEFSDPYDGSVY